MTMVNNFEYEAGYCGIVVLVLAGAGAFHEAVGKSGGQFGAKDPAGKAAESP